ncbi:MAG: hypothetical protein AYK18_07115 [Theionarchaea archaeon DG-70]|nr:MAG: hypothetical protein AYK18_07115 [Theionarchaea archaeon DG-70]
MHVFNEAPASSNTFDNSSIEQNEVFEEFSNRKLYKFNKINRIMSDHQTTINVHQRTKERFLSLCSDHPKNQEQMFISLLDELEELREENQNLRNQIQLLKESKGGEPNG